MRHITHIAIHCTATPQTASIESIRRYWQQTLGWKSPGYHYIIEANGNLVQLAPLTSITNGVVGYNSTLINIAYIGGIDATNRPVDNRTTQQKKALLSLLQELKKQFPAAIIQGHRDFPGVNKACPSFDAKTEYRTI